MNWKKKRNIGGLKDENDENLPDNLPAMDAISFAVQSGYSFEKIIRDSGSDRNNSKGFIFSHPEHADLRIDVKEPKKTLKDKYTGEIRRIPIHKPLTDKKSSTGYRNNDNPIKNSKDDKSY